MYFNDWGSWYTYSILEAVDKDEDCISVTGSVIVDDWRFEDRFQTCKENEDHLIEFSGSAKLI